MWKEGLFVTPQHLQLAERYHERELDQRLASVIPNIWGLGELEIDAEELARGVFQLSRCTAVMPDGLLVQIGKQHRTKGLVLTTGTAAGKTIEVYLGIPSETTRGTPHFAGDAGTVGARFVRQPTLLTDDYGTAEATEIDCLLPNVQLLLGSDQRSNYITIKLAELTVSEEGTLKVSDRYLPPLLRIEANAVLMSQLTRLVNAVSAKQNTLADRYRGRASAIVEFGAADMVTFWYLHTVNSWIPTLMHLSHSGQVHPETLYLALVGLAGQLTTFEQQIDPQSLPRYNHANLGETFFPLFARLEKMLGTVVSQQYKEIPLEQTQPGLFVAKIDDGALLRSHQLYLVAGGEVPPNSLRQDVPQYVKISSLDQIAHIVQAAVTGVDAPIDLSPPTAIPVRAEKLYLKLTQQGRYWDGVLASNTIAIYQPVQPDKVKLELLAVER